MNRNSAFVPAADTVTWETVDPAAAGFDPRKLEDAVTFAIAGESTWPRSFYYADGRYVGIVEWNETRPWSDVLGPVKPRGGPSGLILRGGKIAAEWGDTRATDMTFSIAKSYLAILAGIAVTDGLIATVDEPVGATVKGHWFAGTHNAQITWRHLLQQSSEWQGKIWGKSDQVDHFRQVSGGDNSRKGEKRPLQRPGTYYEYNDVRVNLLAYCLLNLFRRALPEVLKERVMDPIGASSDWQWHGYSNSYAEVDGKRMQSVSGGAHWGGGMFISARDHARLGLLVSRCGAWGTRQILPESWIEQMLMPSPTNESYGFLWWLNRGTGRNPRVPETCVSALGAGSNVIWVDREHDMVAVLRWIDKTKYQEFIGRLVLAAAK